MPPSWMSWQRANGTTDSGSHNFSSAFNNYYLLHPDQEAATKARSYSYGESSISSVSPSRSRSASIEHDSAQFGQVESSAYAVEQDLKRRTLWERLTKRRVVLRFQVGLTFGVLLINIIWTIWSARTYGTRDGIGTIFSGECGKSQLLNVYLHIVINVLSTLLLGTSNYCMQLIAAPTRDEIDRAHAKKTWLDIGVPSARNVWKLSLSNKVTWIGLGITSATLHLFWNSAVFYSFPTHGYRVAVATSDFQNFNQSWPSKAGFEFDLLRESATDLEFLEPADCINRYLDIYNAGKDVIVVTKRTTAENANQTLLTYETAGGAVWYFEEYWICSSTEIHAAMLPGGCTQSLMDDFYSNWTVADGSVAPTATNSLGGGTVEVDHCLSAGLNDSQSQCSVEFSTYIMGIVIAMNALKCGFVLFVYWKSAKFGAIVTLGDAVASFLQEPDHHTEQMCLTTKRTFMGKTAWQPQALQWHPPKTRWIGATTKRRFWITMGFYIATFMTVTGLLGAGIAGRVRDHAPISIGALLSQGLGNPDPQQLLSNSKSGAPVTLLAAVALANVFQLLFSGLYYMYNSVLSCMLVALEWSKYSTQKKSLRVSDPTGAQRSSYFLTIPYRYGIPLLGASSLLQWLVSQSIFLVRTVNYDAAGTSSVESNRIGFAPIGIVASYGLTGLMFFTLLLLTFLRVYPQGDKAMPMVSTCSAAISASCHRDPGDVSAHLLPLQWGVTPGRYRRIDKEVGHCSFTTARDVTRPVEGRLYA